MKKRVVAFLMGVMLFALPAAEAGASEFGETQAVSAEAPESAGEISVSEQPDMGQAAEEDVFYEIPGPEEFQGEMPQESEGPESDDPAQPEEEIPAGDVTEEEPGTSEDDLEDVIAADVFQDGLDVQVVTEDGGAVSSEAETADYIQVGESDWEAVEGRYRLKKTDASAGAEYYTEADGLIPVSTLGAEGEVLTEGYYLFDAEGFLVTGFRTVETGIQGYAEGAPEEYFFVDEAHATLLAGVSGDPTPVNSDLGQARAAAAEAVWKWDGSAWNYTDEYGVSRTVSELESTLGAKGYFTINGSEYCLNADGTPRTGEITLAGGVYYFEETKNADGIPGQMFKGGWKSFSTSSGKQWRYYTPEENPLPEAASLQPGQKLTWSGKMLAVLPGSTDKTYLLNAKGYVQKNTVATIGKSVYLSNANGVIVKNKLAKYKGARWYFDADGKRVTWKNSWHRCPGADNRYYYFGKKAGKVVEKKSQWIRIGNAWYYFDAKGNHYINKLTSSGYYFNQNGKLGSGVKTVNGKTYFFRLSTKEAPGGLMYKSEWISYKGKMYYARANGVLAKGWLNINGNLYYFNKNNTLKVNGFATTSKGVNGYLDASGKFCTGWVVVDSYYNKVKYVNPDEAGFYKNTSAVIDGYRYYFDKDGYRINDLTDKIPGPYAVQVDRQNCVMTVFTADMTTPVKTIRVSVGNPRSLTPTGTFTLVASARWQYLMGPSWGQYGSHVTGGIFVHSVPNYGGPSLYGFDRTGYDLLGVPASHGCIRCCVADARFIFANCSSAKITIFDGTYTDVEAFKGPLGRNPLVPRRGEGNFDPTDPEIP